MFKELTLKDAQNALEGELKKLSSTISNSKDRVDFETQMEGFKYLFERYLLGASEEFDWNKMEPLPAESVSIYHFKMVYFPFV